MSKFDMPNNEDFEKMLKKNIEHTKPLEMKEKTVGDKKYLFPFWKPVKSDGAEHFSDYKEYLNNRDKAVREGKDLTGIVKPKTERESYEDYSIVTNIQNMIKQANGMDDQTGIVKPQAEDMPSNNTNQVTEWDSTTNNTTVEKSTGSETGVGAVKPQSEDMPKTNNDQVTDWDSTDEENKIVEKAAKSKTGVGSVKPQSEDMPKGTTDQVTQYDGRVSEPTVNSNADKPKEDNVGVVNPSADFKMELPKGIDFSRYM